MKVMSYHEWFDEDVEGILYNGHENNRQIILRSDSDLSFVINKEDVIALAKEFDLVVFNQDAKL